MELGSTHLNSKLKDPFQGLIGRIKSYLNPSSCYLASVPLLATIDQSFPLSLDCRGTSLALLRPSATAVMPLSPLRTLSHAVVSQA